MKRKTRIIFSALGLAALLLAGHQLSLGTAKMVVADVTRPYEKRIRAPRMPFRNGNLLVRVDGILDGDATLLMISNRGRDQRINHLSGTLRNALFGGPEEWVDDLVVKYVPGSARKGQLSVVMVCGRNLPEKQ